MAGERETSFNRFREAAFPESAGWGERGCVERKENLYKLSLALSGWLQSSGASKEGMPTGQLWLQMLLITLPSMSPPLCAVTLVGKRGLFEKVSSTKCKDDG